MSKKDGKGTDENRSTKPGMPSKAGPVKLNYDDFKDLIDKSNEKVIS